MQIFGWHISFYMAAGWRPIFHYSTYYQGRLRLITVCKIVLRLSSLRQDLTP